MSLVYLSPHLNSESTGGAQVAKSNLKLLKLLFGGRVQAYAASRYPMPDVHPLSTTKSTIGTACANFQGLCGTLTPKGRFEFLEDMSKFNPNLIWLDSSLFGGLICAIRTKAPNAKVITFFHNAEIDLISQRIKKGSFHYIPAWLATYSNEVNSAKRSDAVVCISTVDGKRISQLFGRTDAQTLPVCLEKNVKNNCRWANTSEVLFVGSAFSPNIEAVNFLNEHVAPLLRTKRIIVAGKGLEKHLSAPRHRNIEFLGFVDDLSVLYNRCSATLAPIFSGGGMKVKIAESLMHGRSVISTNFAAIGYEKASKDSVVLTNTAHGFATAIDTWAPIDLESPERDFDEHYSFNAGLRNLSQIIGDV